MDDLSDPITPELALVDPDLAAVARARLPAPRDCLAPRRPFAAERTAPRQQRTPGRRREDIEGDHPGRRRRRLERVAIALTWLVVAAILGSSLLAFIPPRGSSRPQLLAPGITPETATAPVDPPPGATIDRSSQGGTTSVSRARAVTTVDGGLELRWRPDPRAAFYNVVLFRDGKRIDLWPTVASVSVAAPSRLWSARRTVGIRYRWFVYPAYRSGGAISFGRELAQGSIVARGAR